MTDELVEALWDHMCKPRDEAYCGCSSCAVFASAAARINALTAQLAEARESERAAVVDWLEASAAWHEQHDDGLSGFDGIRQGQFEAMQAIKAGEHLT